MATSPAPRPVLAALLALALLLAACVPPAAGTAAAPGKKKHIQHAVATVDVSSLREMGPSELKNAAGGGRASIDVNSTLVDDGDMVLVTVTNKRPRNKQQYVRATCATRRREPRVLPRGVD